ncbi:MAG: hypothetical protein L3J54_09925, partial [Draconibacterium sp.]|nr:hypothetical protein [Draconibacterium sp.]
TLKNCSEKVSQYAKEKNKIAAISEAGGPIDKNTKWWTEVLETIRPYELSYILVWRNPHSTAGHGSFGPYKGNPSEKNFIKFYNDSHTIFQKEISPKSK